MVRNQNYYIIILKGGGKGIHTHMNSGRFSLTNILYY